MIYFLLFFFSLRDFFDFLDFFLCFFFFFRDFESSLSEDDKLLLLDEVLEDLEQNKNLKHIYHTVFLKPDILLLFNKSLYFKKIDWFNDILLYPFLN